MKHLFIMLVVGFLALSNVVGQETNKEQNTTIPKPMSYQERVERGFGQRHEPRFAGDRPMWQGPRRGAGGPQFRGAPPVPCPVCSLCEQHKKLLLKRQPHR